MISLMKELLYTWCDSLLSLQINEIKSEGIYGGFMCPSCSRIHGRSADAVYPFMYMADVTGEERYMDVAIKLQSWADLFLVLMEAG